MNDDLRARLAAARGATPSNPSITASDVVSGTNSGSITVSATTETPVEITDEDIREMFPDYFSSDTSASTEEETTEEETTEEEVNDTTAFPISDDSHLPWEDSSQLQVNVPEPQPESQPEPVVDSIAERRRRIMRSRIAREATSRFSGAMWYDAIQRNKVTIVGVGGIGSWTTLLISRLGVDRITLYDDDEVEVGNFSGQLYNSTNIGQYKVDALAETIANFSLYSSVTAISERFNENSYCDPVTISCLDSMESRKLVFNQWRMCAATARNKEEYLFIDGRLSAETLQVFAVPGNDAAAIARYEATLFDDTEADSEICSYKQTSFMANMIASFITNVFINYVASQLNGGAAREIPFKVEYLGEMMWLKTDM